MKKEIGWGFVVNMMVSFVLGWLISPAVLAQGPVVDSVEPARGIRGVNDHSLSPGLVAAVIGADFGESPIIDVGGRQAALLSYFVDGSAFATIQIPAELTPGPTTLIVTDRGLSSRPFSISLDSYSPAFAYSNAVQSTFERAVPDGEFSRVSCSPGETPGPGEIVRAYAVGLGATDPAIPTGFAAPLAPPARTVVQPSIAIGGEAAEVLESVLVPGEIGVYRVTFKLPPEAMVRTYQVTVGIGGRVSYPEPLDVGPLVIHGSPPSHPASGAEGPAAPESILRAFGCGAVLVTDGQQYTSDPRNPAMALGGITVKVKDSLGMERLAPLLYASANSVDYIVPAGTAIGPAAVTITSRDGSLVTGKLEIKTVTPRLFLRVNPRPQPVSPAALVVRFHRGEQTIEPFVKPIDLGPETDEVFLVLFGTGWRGRNSTANTGLVLTTGKQGTPVTDVETTHIPAQYAGPQIDFAGMDQMNIRIPRSLAGRLILVEGIEVDGNHQFTQLFQVGVGIR